MAKKSTFDQQLLDWVKGNSIHNAVRDECCPDFSCCRPELLAPLEEREHFLVATEPERTRMLGMFLGRAMATIKPEKKVYIAGCSTAAAAEAAAQEQVANAPKHE